MNKYIDTEKLTERVTNLIASARHNNWPIAEDYLRRVIDIINSLQQEQLEVDLEREAVMFCFDNGINVTPREAKKIAKHFYTRGKA